MLLLLWHSRPGALALGWPNQKPLGVFIQASISRALCPAGHTRDEEVNKTWSLSSRASSPLPLSPPPHPKASDRQTYIGIAFLDEFRPQVPCSMGCWLSHLNLPLAQGSQGTFYTPLSHWRKKEAMGLWEWKGFCSFLLNHGHHMR